MSNVKKIGLHWWIILGMLIGAASGGMLHRMFSPDRDAIRAIVDQYEANERGILKEADRGPLAGQLEDKFDLADGTLDPIQLTSARRADSLTKNAAVAKSGVYQAFDGIANIFLNLLKLVVVPLVFFSLLTGMLGLGSVKHLGRMGGRTFLMYMLTSMLAIVLGLLLVNLIRPGYGVDIGIPTTLDTYKPPASFWTVILDMVPQNFADSAARFDLIEVIVFTILFGGCLLAVPEAKRQTLVGVIEGGCEVMMRMTQFVISLAPVGIAAMIARLVATTGLGVFIEMKWYIVTVLLALLGHMLITLPILIKLTTGLNPYRYFRLISPALLTGFSTASSSGTLGMTMQKVESAGVPNRVSSFVLPLGATINMDGTALYEIVSVLFIAQLHSTLDPTFTLTFGQQLLIVFLGLAVSIGAAGIPHAGLVMMVIILQAVNLPIEYTSIIWAVDRLLDMTRTAVNISSDSSVALIIASRERVHDAKTFAKAV